MGTFSESLCDVDIHRRGPLRRQMFVEFPLVERARLAIHGHEERLVAQRLDVLFEMLGDKFGHRRHALVGFQERLQFDGAIQNPVQILDIRDALRLGDFQKFRLQQFLRQTDFIRRVGVAQFQGGLVLDGFLDGILVEIAVVILLAEHLERAFAVGGLVNRRAGEADERGLGQRGHEKRAEVAAGGTVGLVYQAIDIGAGA